MGMKQQSSVGRVVRKRGVHPRSVCVKFSTSHKIQVKEINEITSRNTLIARKIRNCPFGLSCKYVYLGQNPLPFPLRIFLSLLFRLPVACRLFENQL